MERDFGDFILVDEVGIEVGRYGPFHLKTTYRPIFAPLPEGLRPVAVEAATAAFDQGKAVEWPDFLAGVAPRDRRFVHGLCRVLHLRNHRNIHEEGLRLILDCRPREGFDLDALGTLIGAAPALLEDAELEPGMLVCALPGTGPASDDAALARLAQAARRQGMGVALTDFGSQATPARLEAVAPDIVGIDGSLFRRMAQVAQASRLLDALVSALKRKRATVMIADVQTPGELAAALAAGADLVQGDLLARPALAGTLLDTRPVDPEGFRRGGSKVVRFIR